MGKKASTLEYRTLKSDKAVRPYDPRDKKQKEITDKQNPISLYDEQTKELVYGVPQIEYVVKSGRMMFFPSYMPHLYTVDEGTEPFRFIHWNCRAYPKNI